MPVTPHRSPLIKSNLEHHYTVGEVAELWNVCENTVRNLFFEEEGVLRIGQGSRLLGGRAKKLKRHYFVLRIPESVLLRVQNRLMHKRPPGGSVPPGRISTGTGDFQAST